MDRFDLVKSLVNQKFGEVRVLIEDDGVLCEGYSGSSWILQS